MGLLLFFLPWLLNKHPGDQHISAILIILVPKTMTNQNLVQTLNLLIQVFCPALLLCIPLGVFFFFYNGTT